jgi:hypothetical protein
MAIDQSPLFITDIHDALGDIVRAIGGPKAVGLAMRPERPADEAAGWVKDCLNRNRREKFDPEQILWLLKRGREIGCHEPIKWICGQAGYSAPEPIEEETELAKLLRGYIELGARLATMQPKIEELRAKLRAA